MPGRAVAREHGQPMPEPRRLVGSAEVSLQVGADAGQASAARGGWQLGWWGQAGITELSDAQHQLSLFPLFHLNPLCLFIHEKPSYLQSEIFLTSLARLFPSEEVPGVIEPAPLPSAGPPGVW